MAALAAAWNTWVRYPGQHPVGRRNRIGTYRRMISWQLRSRIASGPVVSPWINGARLLLRKGQAGATGNLYYGLHEYTDMAFFAHMLRKNDVFADIGANVGSYTVLAAKVAGATVHAFEPINATADALDANVAVNDIADRVTVHRVALSNAAGVARFTTGHDAMNHLADKDAIETVEVTVDTADARLAGRGVIAMKVDVEGAEDKVFSAAHALLGEPQLIAIEVETLGAGVRETIEAAGFLECWYDPATRLLTDLPNGIARNNHLFLRNKATVADRLIAGSPICFGKVTI